MVLENKENSGPDQKTGAAVFFVKPYEIYAALQNRTVGSQSSTLPEARLAGMLISL